MATIAVIGAGSLGGALGSAFAKLGHNVRYGVRDPESDRHRKLTEGRPTASVHNVDEAVAPAEVVFLSTPWQTAEAAVKSAGNLSGKILIDCTNPLVMRDGVLSLALGHDDSGGEAVARWAKGASVFKTCNQTGFQNMANAAAFDPKAVMLVAGDDKARKPVVLDLVASLGFEAVDFGGLQGARQLEPLAMAWIKLSFGGLGRDFAFALTRAKSAIGKKE